MGSNPSPPAGQSAVTGTVRGYRSLFTVARRDIRGILLRAVRAELEGKREPEEQQRDLPPGISTVEVPRAI